MGVARQMNPQIAVERQVASLALRSTWFMTAGLCSEFSARRGQLFAETAGNKGDCGVHRRSQQCVVSNIGAPRIGPPKASIKFPLELGGERPRRGHIHPFSGVHKAFRVQEWQLN